MNYLFHVVLIFMVITKNVYSHIYRVKIDLPYLKNGAKVRIKPEFDIS